MTDASMIDQAAPASDAAADEAWRRVQLARHPAASPDARPGVADLRGLLRAARRPRVRRRSGHRRRPGAARGTAGDGHRPPEGHGHRVEHPPQLRLAASRGIPQGAAPHAAGRQARHAGRHLPRHGRGLPRAGGRGARPGRGDRLEHQAHDRAAGADRGRSCSARAAPAARWRSASATSSWRSRMPCTRSSAPRAPRRSCGAHATRRASPPRRCA